MKNERALEISFYLLIIMLILVSCSVLYFYYNGKLITAYAKGGYAINGTEGMCNKMNKTYFNERCYLREIDNFTINDSFFNLDCSWGNYTVEVNTSHRINATSLKIDEPHNFKNRVQYYIKLNPVIWAMECKLT